MSSCKSEEQLVYELSCPICLQLFSDPVVLPCGHNYCQACILKSANTAGKNDNILRCPECREEFQSVDTLQRNFKLCSIIEGYIATAPLLDRQPETEHERIEVLCDHCIDEQSPAVKTCLKCEVSLCSRHFQRHQEKESFRGHTVVGPMDAEGMRGCAVHRRPFEYFCSSDMALLCATCFKEGFHQKHDVLTFSVAEEEMRRALESRTKVISSRLQVMESLLQKTAEEVGASEAVGVKLVNSAVSVMDNIAALVDRYRARLHVLLEEERGQRRNSWQQGLGALEIQKQQLLEAQQSVMELLNESDTCAFIHRFMLNDHKLREVVAGAIPAKIPSKAPLNTKRLQAGLKTQDFSTEMTCLLESLHMLLNPLELTFNIFTSHPSLILSNDLRTLKYSSTKQSYVEHPERFTSAPQVLCCQGFSCGEHVWVVEVGPNTQWSLGVCYKSIPRRGDHSRLGHNSVSWRLQWKNRKLTVCQSSSNVALGEVTNHPLRIEVALDYEGGTLIFHSTKGRREHLHTFRAVFREPVFPAFSIHSSTPESWITLQSGM
ncbi:E3 ubiquitin/ISG15 ligase TRIM25-like [Notolabrus celidotus]|uniref:E3 ubiquitin/ISG15 ligase TRIM25-like n=1 Tax=Notolabrus celidotus TaxID=1203425 RepID=UPI00148FEFE0|nr:E3 ubiquitin/ISG15 ligase TRIM25-like [Notolabrus celidotus]XP_034550959.1 E3 ubiquitin/ISG15 ligase TRIM25-like [Notolabrus celidotus]